MKKTTLFAYNAFDFSRSFSMLGCSQNLLQFQTAIQFILIMFTALSVYARDYNTKYLLPPFKNTPYQFDIDTVFADTNMGSWAATIPDQCNATILSIAPNISFTSIKELMYKPGGADGLLPAITAERFFRQTNCSGDANFEACMMSGMDQSLNETLTPNEDLAVKIVMGSIFGGCLLFCAFRMIAGAVKNCHERRIKSGYEQEAKRLQSVKLLQERDHQTSILEEEGKVTYLSLAST